MRPLHLAAALAAAFAIAGSATAQVYPSRPITLIVPFAPGGPTDVTSRIIGEHMSRTLGQQLVIENVAGAGGTIGSTRAMRATPDGYTIQMGQMGTHAGSVGLYPNLAYKPDVDFAPIGLVVDQAVVIFARKDFPPTDLKEFVAYVKTNGERLNVGHAGIGSISHFTCLLLDSMLDVKPAMVPFSGAGPAVNALMGSQVDYMCDSISDVVQQIQGGTIGSTRAMRSPPDGYTIQMGQMGTHAGAVGLYPKLAYKPDVDFEPIGLVVDQAVVIFARRDFPPADFKEFVSYVKANGDTLNVGHAGVGSISHFTALLLDSILGVKPTMVPFSGAGPAINALVGSQVDYMTDSISSPVQQIQAGTAKGYAVATPQRNPALPNLPTTREAGLPEFQATGWYALFAPKGTPKPILDKLTNALDKALDDDNVRKRLADLGCDIPGRERRGPAPLASLVKSEITRWTPVIQAANVKIE